MDNDTASHGHESLKSYLDESSWSDYSAQHFSRLKTKEYLSLLRSIKNVGAFGNKPLKKWTAEDISGVVVRTLYKVFDGSSRIKSLSFKYPPRDQDLHRFETREEAEERALYEFMYPNENLVNQSEAEPSAPIKTSFSRVVYELEDCDY